MSKLLDVYLHDSLVGQLEQDQHGQISFTYSGACHGKKVATCL